MLLFHPLVPEVPHWNRHSRWLKDGPGSLTSITVKIMEHVIYSCIMAHSTKHDLSPSQHFSWPRVVLRNWRVGVRCTWCLIVRYMVQDLKITYLWAEKKKSLSLCISRFSYIVWMQCFFIRSVGGSTERYFPYISGMNFLWIWRRWKSGRIGIASCQISNSSLKTKTKAELVLCLRLPSSSFCCCLFAMDCSDTL